MKVLESLDDQNLALEVSKKSLLSAINRISLPKKDDFKLSEPFSKNFGVFTTLYSSQKESGTLRGCIGLPYPNQPLFEAIVSSAVKTATSDPRFPSVQPNEIKYLSFELEILSVPTRVYFQSSEDLEQLITIGEDGLILQYKGSSGLLLPNVPTKYNWDFDTYIEGIFRKAWVDINSLLDKELKLFKFQAQILQDSL